MHNSYDEVVDDVRATNELLKEEAKQGWMFWVGAAVLFLMLWTAEQADLVRGIAFIAGLGFYYAYKWHAELNRRLLLSNRLLLTLVKRTVPEEAD